MTQEPRRYQWDGNVKRYRDPRGRFVAEKQILNLLNVAVDAKQVVLLTRSYKAGNITSETWHAGMRQSIKNAHIQAALLARGGRNSMTPQDWGLVGGHLAEQYYHLDAKANSFLFSIDSLTSKQAEARARMYVEASRQVFEELSKANKIEIGAIAEKWMLGHKEHCPDCLELAGLGWVPIGTLWTIPGAGDTQCLTNCGCHVAYRNQAGRTLRAKDIIKHYLTSGMPFTVVATPLGDIVAPGRIELTEDSHMVRKLGGPGSGHFGHAGRPGRRGGSAPKGAGGGGLGTVGGKHLVSVDHYWNTHDDTDPDFDWERIYDGGEHDRDLAKLFGGGRQDRMDSYRTLSGDVVLQERRDTAAELSGELNLPKDAIEYQLTSWFDPSSPMSVLAKDSVSRALDVPMSDHDIKLLADYETSGRISSGELTNTEYTGTGIFKALRLGDGLPALSSAQRDSLVQGVYGRTQGFLAENLGARTHVRLYRGTKNPEILGHDTGAVVRLEASSISSWSASPSIARQFGDLGGAVLAMDVPVSKIFSLPMTGFGERSMGEVLLLGGETEAVVYESS